MLEEGILTESPTIHFLRGMVLLLALVIVPGIAVCWNVLSKKSEPVSAAAIAETPPVVSALPEPVVGTKNTEKRMELVPPASISAFAPETGYTTSPVPLPGVPSPPQQQHVPGAAQQVVWNEVPQEKPEIQQDFQSLERRLKALGAKYYRLEKWGNRGELFRFSCFVSPPEPYHYEKYFQIIGSDELRVMESIIEKIEQWKSEFAH
jgi:hypothetical protein